MAVIITTHISMNEAAAPGQVCPGILIHAIDMTQPPGMAMPPDIDRQEWIVIAALAMNKRALVPRNARSRGTRSTLVFVVAAHPELRVLMAGLIPAFRHQVQVVIGRIQHVDAARMR